MGVLLRWKLKFVGKKKYVWPLLLCVSASAVSKLKLATPLPKRKKGGAIEHFLVNIMQCRTLHNPFCQVLLANLTHLFTFTTVAYKFYFEYGSNDALILPF